MRRLIGAAVLAVATGFGLSQALLAQDGPEGAAPPQPPQPPAVTEPSFLQLDPGRYRMTMRLGQVRGRLDAQASAALKAMARESNSETTCIRAGDRNGPFPGHARDDCQVVSSSLDGARASGLLRCADSRTRGTISFDGTFAHDSAQLAFDFELRSKGSPGPVNFTMNLTMERIGDNCEPGD